MSVFWSEAPRPEIQSGPLHEQANVAYRRQWEAAAEYVQAMREGDSHGQYLALRTEERLCRCDGCGTTCDLNSDGTIITADDEVICEKCCEVRVEE